MPAFGAVTALASLGFAAYQYGKSRKDKRQADAAFQKAQADRKPYETPQSELDAAALAKSQLNAVNPATIALQQQAQQQTAAAQGYAQRNAASGAQALQAGANANAQAYANAPQIAMQDNAFRQQGMGNYLQTQRGLTQDAQYKHQDQVAANSDLQNYYLGRVGAAQQDGSSAIALGVQSGLGAMNAIGGMYGANGMRAAKQPALATGTVGLMPATARPLPVQGGNQMTMPYNPNYKGLYGMNGYQGYYNPYQKY